MPMPTLVGRRVKLRRAGRGWIGCCPFHNEKSPSFHVYDDHFHCYGCGAHGDAISFLMKTTEGSFIDAVEALAGEVGLELPRATPAQVTAEQSRLNLHEVLDQAQASFVRRLHAVEGANALTYLRTRGLTDASIAQFGLGWSGDGRGSLLAELRDAGIDSDRAFEAGLMREADDGSRRELYWGRITFPIRDRRGRLISFGGRALGDIKPKYINGPDTPLFHKRRTLFAIDLARAGLQSRRPLIVAEGYMDVIALHQAGFSASVAPLGTALTDDHLTELWRLSEAPTLCFDGDAAGARAAERSIMLALPLLKPGLTIKIATLPLGEDPDSLIQSGGARAFDAVIASARPLVDALYSALAAGTGPTPEQRAALRTRLDAAANAIRDRTLAAEFRTALRDRFFASRRKSSPVPSRPVRKILAAEDVAVERAMLLTMLVLEHPAVLHDIEEAYAGLDLPPDLARLREHILHADQSALLNSNCLLAHLTHSGMAELVARVRSTVPASSNSQRDAMPAEAEAEWWHIYGLMNRARLVEQIALARRAFEAEPDTVSQRRLVALCSALEALSDAEGDLGPQ